MKLFKFLFQSSDEDKQFNAYEFFNSGIAESEPKLNVSSSTVPQSYLNQTKIWDSHLYDKQTILNDVK